MGAIVCQLRKAHLTPALGGRNMSCHMAGHMFRHMLKRMFCHMLKYMSTRIDLRG